MDSKIIIKMIETIGNPTMLTFALVFLVLIAIFKKEISNLFNNLPIKRNKSDKKQRIIQLKNHDIFDALKRVVNEVHVMLFYTSGEYDKVKTKMCYDFAKEKAKHCSIKMNDILEFPNIDKIPTEELRSLITKSQNEMHANYIRAIRELWHSKGVPTEDVDYVVHLFEKFRYDVVNSFDHRITSVFGSGFHKNNFDIVLAVFDIWAMGIDLLPKDMKTTFENLNGKFKNIRY